MPMMTSLTIPVAFDLILLLAGIKSYIEWRIEYQPMILCVGGTGTGKSYALSLLMARIITHIMHSQLFLCDFKDIDFRAFVDAPRRWSFELCSEGLAAFFESFQNRLSGADKSTNRKFLVFDEWASYVISLDKKSQEDAKNKLSTLLMMGRGVQHHVVIGLQRADAQLFPLGGRDQFGAILALGNLSREQKLMLFPDYREEMNDINGRGQGYLYLDGETQPLKRIQIPRIVNQQMVDDAIREGLTR